MKFFTLFIFCALTITGCAKNRGLKNDADVAAHNRDVSLAILCGLGGHAMDSSGKCDFSKKSNNLNNSLNTTNPRSRVIVDSGNSANSQIIFACGSAGMSVNFVTGNCVNSSGGQVNPRNVTAPSIPVPRQSSQDLVMRCGSLGKSVDFATGRCI